jgi:hypothetical protein
MVLLKKIAVSNFQCLKKVVLDLGLVNVIVGETGHGKTALYEALASLPKNRPPRDSQTHGEDDFIVGIETEEGVSIGWKKGKSNYYRVVENGEKAEWDKVGASCPDGVLESLKMSQIDVGDVSIHPNYHGQFDIPFLQDMPGSTVAKILGEITGINRLGKASKVAQGYRSRNNARLSVLSETLDKVTEELRSYSDVDDLLEQLAKLEGAAEEIKGIEKKISEAEIRTFEFDASVEVLMSCEIKCSMLRRRVEALKDVEECKEKLKEYTAMFALEKAFVDHDDSVKKWNRKVGREGVKIEALSALDDCEKLMDFLVKADFWDRKAKACDYNIENWGCKETDTQRAFSIVEVALRNFKKKNKVCPMCGKAFDEVADCE